MSIQKFNLLCVSILMFGCASQPDTKEVRQEDRKKVEDALQGEVSLKADRDRLAELRAEIPKDKQKSNDELALFLELMSKETQVPGAVREKFQTMVMKRRETFREKVRDLRDDFRDDERKKREAFLSQLKEKRENFVSSKHDSKASRDFFTEQDKERRRYFADEQDRRKNFESEVRDQTKEFEFYMKERMAAFNEQHRLYSKAYYERMDDKKRAEKKATEAKQAEAVAKKKSTADEFEDMNKVDATPLGTDD